MYRREKNRVASAIESLVVTRGGQGAAGSHRRRLGLLAGWARFIVPSEDRAVYVWPKFLEDIEDAVDGDLR